MKKILIIENSALTITILKNVFVKNSTLEIFVAKSFFEVENLLEKHNFFVVISNLILPDAPNFEVLKLLAKHKLPTIVFSASIESQLLHSSEYPNIADYVLKDTHGLSYIHRLIETMQYCINKEVLVVDDSTVASQFMKRTLEKFFLKVMLAKDGLEALELIKHNPNISLMIADFHMPKMDGLELLKIVKADKTCMNLPIIMITGKNDNELKIKLYKYGASDLLLKPILEEELSAKLINIFLAMKQVEEISEFNIIVNENVITSSTNSAGKIYAVSKAFCEMSGYSQEELIGQNHNILRHPDMPDSLYEDLWKTIASGNVWRGEVKNKKKDGSHYWVDAIIKPKFSKDGFIEGYHALRHDITDKKRIYELSITDGLTSLYNRRYFNDIADGVLADSLRDNEVFAFALLDVDNFKKYNDTYGHQDGDSVLINIAAALQECFKESKDIVFRLGGEEFGVLINAKNIEDIYTLTESARKSIESLAIEHKLNPPQNVLTASFGVSIVTNETKNKFPLDVIYKEADDALYKSKEAGKNQLTYKII